jgi:hypothetical protein
MIIALMLVILVINGDKVSNSCRDVSSRYNNNDKVDKGMKGEV